MSRPEPNTGGSFTDPVPPIYEAHLQSFYDVDQMQDQGMVRPGRAFKGRLCLMMVHFMPCEFQWRYVLKQGRRCQAHVESSLEDMAPGFRPDNEQVGGIHRASSGTLS